MLGSFYEKSSKEFNVTIRKAGSLQNIVSDTVKLYLHDISDSSEALEVSADVTSEGASGIAKFAITPTQLTITPQKYIATIEWVQSSNKYILVREYINVETKYINEDAS